MQKKKKVEPVDPRVRLAIARWPDDAPRGSVSTFCAEHGISRKTFYVLRARAREEGEAAVLEPKSRRPRHSPSRISEQLEQQALDVRAALERSGFDHGPISVFEKMKSMGLSAPSEASLARIFRKHGVARREPNKRPRAAYRRFVYPAPNCLWQLDASEYVLTGGRKCVIFQLEDDHSRLAVASHVAHAETSADAIAVMRKGIAKHGVPQRLLTDNGAAMNPTRRGWIGALVVEVESLGVQAITGRPGRPTTQGKNERFHQTLFKWLGKRPLVDTIAELQAQVDRFDVLYNTTRPHQSLPGRITPQRAWDATPVAEPPRPAPAPIQPVLPRPEPATAPDPTGPRRGAAIAPALPTNEYTRTVNKAGSILVRKVTYQIGRRYIGHTVHLVFQPETDTVSIYAATTGELLLEHPTPPPGTTYVSNRQRPPLSPMS